MIKNALKDFLKIIALFFIVKIMLGFLFATIIDFNLLNSYQLDTSHKLKENLKSLWFIPIIIMGPIIEEFIFRGIVSKTKRGLYLSILGGAILVLGLILKPIDITNNFRLTLISLFIILSIFYLNYQITKKAILVKIPIIIIAIISSFLFAIFHISNYAQLDLAFNEKIILVIPHFFTGLFYCWVRVKFSIAHSIFIHGFSNSLALI